MLRQPIGAPHVAARDRLRLAGRLRRRGARPRRIVAARHHGLELERLDDERGVGRDAEAEMARVQLAERRV